MSSEDEDVVQSFKARLSLLRTGSPQGCEARSLESRLIAVKNEMEILTRISHLVHTELIELEHQSHLLHNANAWISRLPNEIVAHIFLLGLHAIDSQTRDTQYLPVITQVSSSWRSIALACPRLWSYIDCNCGSSASLNTPLARVRAYLARSKAAPLELAISLQHNGMEPPVFGVLKPHFRRCSAIRIATRGQPRISSLPDEPLLSLIEPLPLLRSINIIGIVGFLVMRSPLCPRLQDVTLDLTTVPNYDFADIGSHSPVITRLHLMTCTENHHAAIRFASSCLKLESFVLSDHHKEVDDSVAPPSVSFPSLTWLEMSAEGDSMIGFVSSAPMLKHLALHTWRDAPAQGGTRIPQLPKLTSLDLRRMILRDPSSEGMAKAITQFVTKQKSLARIALVPLWSVVPLIRSLMCVESSLKLSQLRLIRFEVRGLQEEADFLQWFNPLIHSLLDQYPPLCIEFTVFDTLISSYDTIYSSYNRVRCVALSHAQPLAELS